MKGVEIEPVNKNVKREIATNQEVCDLLHLAHSREYNFRQLGGHSCFSQE